VSTYLLDVPELYRRLDRRRTERGLSWRQVAAQLDISASTISRMTSGKRPDADALITFIVWLDLDTDIALMVQPKEQI
jgi:transcriptional regulator with XRE-family HTH domain